MNEATENTEIKAPRRKTLKGRVVSDKMEKTIVVAVDRRKKTSIVFQDYQSHEEVYGARLQGRRRNRRFGNDRRDKAAVEAKKLAARRDTRESGIVRKVNNVIMEIGLTPRKDKRQ